MFSYEVKVERYSSPKLHVSVYGKPRLIRAKMTVQIFEREAGEDDGAHLRHCNRGEWEGACKYGEAETCPALRRGRLVGTGHAYCAASDSYQRSEGWRRAKKRAAAQAVSQAPPEQRPALWAALGFRQKRPKKARKTAEA